jgi:hypothetical protein
MNRTTLLRTLFLFAFLSILAFTIPQSYGQCPTEVEWTLSPAPVNGSYAPGQVVEICGEIVGYDAFGSDFLGIVLDFPEHWDISSVEATEIPESCSGSEGEWLFIQDIVLPQTFEIGTGFFFENFSGEGSGDGNPFNDWGDQCMVFGATWSFCISVTLESDCGGPDDELEGAEITPAITLMSDHVLINGPWLPPCTYQEFSSSEITLNCCDGASGGSVGTVVACQDDFFLLDGLIPPFAVGGMWTGPGGMPSLGIFSPGSSPVGTYTYSVAGTDGCISSTSFEIVFEDLGIVQYVVYCQAAPVSLFGWIPNPTQIPGGVWTDPDGNVVPSGMVNEEDYPSGVYTYSYENQEGCPATLAIDLTFGGDWGASAEATTIDICPTSPPFFLLDSLNTSEGSESVFPGGQWIHEYVGPPSSFVDFYPNAQVLIDPLELEDNSVFTYAVGVAPCTPQFVTLHVNVHFPPNTGQNTAAELCINEGPTLLESLLNGNPDPGLTWTDINGDAVSNPIDPSSFSPGTSMILVYSGIENVLGCGSTSILTLTFTDFELAVGEYTEISVDPLSQPFLLIDSLGGNPLPGGIWLNPQGDEVALGLFVPGVSAFGLYTYLLETDCGTETQTMLIMEDSGIWVGSEWEFALPGGNGVYEPGESVDFNIQFSLAAPQSWRLHGIVLDFPPAWDLQNAVAITPPETCGNAGEWIFMEDLVNGGVSYGPGFYFDGGDGAPLDGDPTNNLGDDCTSIGFSLTLQLQDDCAQIGNEPYDITPSILLTPDGLTGSGTDGVITTINVIPGTEMAPLMPDVVDPGEDNEITYPSGSSVFLLVDSLLGTPDPGGVWTDPAGAVLIGGVFIPGTSADGAYAYTVSGACDTLSANLVVNTAEIELSANDSFNKDYGMLIFPNPAKDHVQLVLHEDVFVAGKTELKVFNVLGEMVLSVPLEVKNASVNTQNLASGTYLLVVLANETHIGNARLVLMK